MIKSEWFYWLVGAVFLVMAAQMVFDRSNPKRYGSGAFWGLLGRHLLLQHLGGGQDPALPSPSAWPSSS